MSVQNSNPDCREPQNHRQEVNKVDEHHCVGGESIEERHVMYCGHWLRLFLAVLAMFGFQKGFRRLIRFLF